MADGVQVPVNLHNRLAVISTLENENVAKTPGK